MPRRADPERKPAMLAAIIEALRDRPLSSVTFRSLAEALDVSTFALVYHFGTHDELVVEIVQGLVARQQGIIEAERSAPPTLDAHLEAVRESWHGAMQPLVRPLLRLEMEAALLEVVRPDLRAGARDVHARWLQWQTDSLERLGVPADRAALESRLLVDQLYGLQFDLVISGDDAAVESLSQRAIDDYRERITAVLVEPSA